MKKSLTFISSALLIFFSAVNVAQASPYLATRWSFSGQFTDSSGGSAFAGVFRVENGEELLDGSAGFNDMGPAYFAHTNTSGGFSDRSYRLIAIAPLNRLLFTNAAYATGANGIPTDVLELSCGATDYVWWDSQTTQHDCTLTEYQNIVYAGDFKDPSGPNMITRTTSSISLQAEAFLPEPSSIVLVSVALFGTVASRRSKRMA
jgi:hypothetical protein